MWNKFTCIGNVGRGGAELRYTPNGKAVANFSLATTSGWGDSKATAWIRVTIWGKLAENLSQYITQGKQLLVVGELQPDPETGGPRIWTDTNGVARSSFEITAREIRLLGGKTESEEPEENDMPF